MTTSDDRDQRVDEAIAEYLAGCETGTPPDRAAFLAKHAEVADSLQAFLADHDHMRQAAASPASPDDTNTLPPGGAAARPAPMPLGSIKYFGDYELLDEIARGGMGVVYRARQVSLNRVVAVKLILAGEFAGGRDVKRFRAEAEAAANLDHPNILPIYEVGEHAGQQYFSMKLVEGGNLSQRLAQSPPIAMGGLVEMMGKVARAVHYAHQRGILHRDLKPGNILLDADGTPYVTDFGLAKKVEGDSGLTQSGALVGTPSYMPPEQARGEKRVTTAADVYSLGAILYEVLTGRPPFRADTVLDTVLQVIEREPDPPRTINPAADRDLSVIALKCLDKDPARRYPSAAALADDLDRWANGEPILARPTPAWEKGWKWAKRRPAAAALLATCALAAAAGVAGLAISRERIAEKQRETNDALLARTEALDQRTAALDEVAESLRREQDARTETDAALEKVKEEQGRTQSALAAERRAAYLSDIALSASEWNGNRPLRALQLLDGCPADLRGWEWHHLQRVAHSAEREFDDLEGVTLLRGFSSDGKYLLTTDSSAVRIREFATGKEIRAFTDHEYTPTTAAFSPDGKRVASAAEEIFSIGDSKKGEVILWETETGRPIRTFATDHKGISSLAFSPDGKQIATTGGDHTVCLWSADGSKELHRWTLTTEQLGSAVPTLAFSPDGKRLAAGGATTIVWNVETKAEVQTFKGEARPMFSPDGKFLATVRGTSELVVRDAAAGTEVFAQRIDMPGLAMLAFAPDSKRIAVGGYDGIVRTLDVATKTELQVIRGQQGWVMGLAFSPDGTRLITSVGDPIFELFAGMAGRSPSPAAVRVWDVARGQDYRLLPGAGKVFVVHPKGAEVAVVSGKEVAFYDPTSGMKLRSFALAPEDITAVAYSPDGATLAVAWSVPAKQGKEISPGVHETHSVKNPHRVQLFDAATGKPKADPHAQEISIGAMLFNSDGTLLAITGWGKTLTLIDAKKGQAAATLEGADGGTTHLAFGQGGMLIRATTGSVSWSQLEPEKHFDGVIEVWDVIARKRLRMVNAGKGLCNAVAVSPDGNLLAAAIGDTVTLVRLDTGEQKSLPIAAHTLTFSPDGQRLVAGTPVGVKFWDPISGRDILTLGGTSAGGGNTSRIAFANPAGLVLVNEVDGLRVYDGRPWTPPPVVAAKPTPPEPKQDAPADDRPDAVKTAVGQSVAALDARDPTAAALHAVAALEADPDAVRQQMHRLRVALALQATPKLRQLLPPGATEPTGFAPDKVVDRPGTPNVCDPTQDWDQNALVLRSADCKRFATWNYARREEEVKAGGSRGQVRFWDAEDGKPLGAPINLGRMPFWRGVALSPDGKRLAAIFHTADPPKNPATDELEDPNAPPVVVVRVWDMETGKRIGPDMTAPRERERQPGVQFAAGGRLVIVTTSDWSGNVAQMIFDVDTGKLLTLAEPVRAIYGGPEDPLVVTAPGGSGGRGNQAHVRNARTLAVVGKPLAVSDLRFAASDAAGNRVVLANSYWLGAWDVKTGERLHSRFWVYGGAKGLAISADGSRFAAGYRDRGLDTSFGPSGSLGWARVWDAATGDAVSPPIKTAGVCHEVRLVGGGRVLLTVTETEVRLWEARTGEPLTAPLADGDRAGFDDRNKADALVVGDMLFVRRNVQTSQYDRWSLAADERPVADLRELAEALAGRHRDVTGNLQPIPADELFALRKHLAGRFPEHFGGPVSSPDGVMTRRPDPRAKQLAERLADPKPGAFPRHHLAAMLGQLQDPVSQGPLVAALHDADVTVRRSAAGALGMFDPPAAETVRALAGALAEEKDTRARENAARALHGTGAKTATAELLRALKEDPTAGVRGAAAYSLRTATAEPALLSALRAASADGQPWGVRVEAAMTLAVHVPDAKEPIGVLSAALATETAYLAAQYLNDLGPRAAPAAAALTKVVEKGKYQPGFIEETWYAIHALAKIGPAARPALPALLAKLGQDQSNPNWYNPTTKYVAVHDNMIAYTLGRIGPDAVPDLLKVFKEDKDAHRRRAAVLALGYLGPPAKEAVADLEAEAKKLADKEEKTSDEQFLATALEKALGRIRDPNAIPIEKLE
jgi:eukaryotic-like serine/threonine-protein kinase